MKCQVCQKEKEKGKEYKFLAYLVGETTRKKTGYKEYTYTTPYDLIDKQSGFVCRTCYWKSLLLSEVTLIMIAGPLLLILGDNDGAIAPGNIFLGLVLSCCALVMYLLFTGGFYYCLDKYGDRALIRLWRKDPKYKKKGVKLLDRSKAAYKGFIKREF